MLLSSFQEEKLLKKLSAAQLVFRKFFLGLLANEKMKANYMKREYEKEYGATFTKKLTQLTGDFVSSIEEILPPTLIHRVSSLLEVTEILWCLE